LWILFTKWAENCSIESITIIIITISTNYLVMNEFLQSIINLIFIRTSTHVNLHVIFEEFQSINGLWQSKMNYGLDVFHHLSSYFRTHVLANQMDLELLLSTTPTVLLTHTHKISFFIWRCRRDATINRDDNKSDESHFLFAFHFNNKYKWNEHAMTQIPEKRIRVLSCVQTRTNNFLFRVQKEEASRIIKFESKRLKTIATIKLYSLSLILSHKDCYPKCAVTLSIIYDGNATNFFSIVITCSLLCWQTTTLIISNFGLERVGGRWNKSWR
jgi:hypothetical protein